jgi:hypothetical protein
MREAARLAPQAFAHAEALRRDAEAAHGRGETASAAIAAERALVAYERANVLARIARATRGTATASEELSREAAALASLEAERKRLEADAGSLEARVKSLENAEPPPTSGKADPAREAARLAAARAIALDARLLCVAVRLGGSAVAGIEDAESAVQRLEAALADAPRPAPIDEARRARARCMALLTEARRTAAATSRAPTTADVVLAEVSSKTDLAPHRDERGVVVRVAGDLANLKGASGKNLSAIAAVAAGHPELPLLVVAHTRRQATAADRDRARSRADQIMKLLEDAGLGRGRARLESGGSSQPLHADPNDPRNDRFEIVLVAPDS